MSTTKTRVEKLATVIVPVADTDRAIEFYVEKLGFTKRTDVPFGDGMRWVEVAPGDAETTIATRGRVAVITRRSVPRCSTRRRTAR